MNIIIVFTSPNHDEYIEEWRCINNTENECKKEWANGECKLFIFNGKSSKYWGKDRWKLDALATEIKAIAKTKNAKIVVLFHTLNDEDVKGLQKKLSNHPIPIHQYSSAKAFDLDIWKEHIVKFCFENGRRIEKKFISLLNDLQKKSKESDLYNLRYEILSPLVALDLIQQAEGDNTLDENDNLTELKGNIRVAIDALEAPIEEFCKVPIKCDEFEEHLRELMKPEYHSPWEKYHKDLKNVAEQMETQIAAIET